MNKFKREFCYCIAMAALLFAGQGAAKAQPAENWTRFRGPNGTGHAEGNFPVTWTAADYRWKIALPGKGQSSPVGWGDRVFISSTVGESSDVALLCVSLKTGEVLWQKTLSGEAYPLHADNSFASSTSTTDESQVYFTWSTPASMNIVAYTHEGDEVWRRSLGPIVGPHGFSASPIVIDGVVCVESHQPEQGVLFGLDAATGLVRWEAPRPVSTVSYATPCVIDYLEGPVVVSQSVAGGLMGVDAHTGDVAWQLADVFEGRCVNSPLLSGNRLYSICGGGGVGRRLIGVTLAESKSTKPAETLRLDQSWPYVPCLVVKDNLMFQLLDRGTASCIDLASDTPEKPLWTKRVGGNFYGSPILMGDKLYAMSLDGEAVVLAASREYAVLGRTGLGEKSSATPAVHQGQMLLRTESTLACLPPLGGGE